MKSPKLILALTMLDTSEWKGLMRFVLMYTTEGTIAYQLLTSLYKQRVQLKDSLDLEVLRTAQFPNLTNKGFSNELSKLFQWVEKFLVFYHLQQDGMQSDLLLTKIYNRRGRYKLGDQSAAKLHKRIAVRGGFDTRKVQLQSELLYFQYFSDNPIKYRERNTIMGELVTTHLTYMHSRLLLLYIESGNWGQLQNLQYDELRSTMWQMIESVQKMKYPESDVLAEMKLLVIDQDVNAMHKLLSRLQHHEIAVESDLHQLVVVYLTVVSLRLWRAGDLDSTKDIMTIYNYALQSGVLLDGGRIPVARYHILIATVASLSTYDEAIDFVETWTGKVNSKNLGATKSLALAQLCFHHNRYADIQANLRAAEFTELSQKIQYYQLSIAALYEEPVRDYTILKSFLRNFQRYLNRIKGQVSTGVYKGNINFVKVIEKLILRDFSRRATINLNNYKYLSVRKWLTEKVNK